MEDGERRKQADHEDRPLHRPPDPGERDVRLEDAFQPAADEGPEHEEQADEHRARADRGDHRERDQPPLSEGRPSSRSYAWFSATMYVVVALVDAQSARAKPAIVTGTPVDERSSIRRRLSPRSSVASVGMNVSKRVARSAIVSGAATSEKTPTASSSVAGIAKNELYASAEAAIGRSSSSVSLPARWKTASQSRSVKSRRDGSASFGSPCSGCGVGESLASGSGVRRPWSAVFAHLPREVARRRAETAGEHEPGCERPRARGRVLASRSGVARPRRPASCQRSRSTGG